MKVLFLANTTAGGEWIATQTLIEKLKKNNERLKLYLVYLSGGRPPIINSLFEEVVFVKNKQYNKPFKYYREFFDLLISGKKAISYVCKKHKFSNIIASDYSLTTSYLLSQKKSNYLYLFHGIRNNYRIFFDTFNHYMVLKKLLEMFAWVMSKKIIIPSGKTRDFLINNYGWLLKNKPFAIVPNLIRNDFMKKYSRSEINQFRKTHGIKNMKIILYSGRLVFNKGVENLIVAFLMIEAKSPKMTLIITHPGNSEPKLLNMIKTLINKGKKIMLINNLKTMDLSKLYQAAYLAIIPSPFEVSSLFLRESLMSGLPIVSTKTGDVNEILSNHFLLKNNEVNTIYSKINDHCYNESKYKRFFLEDRKKFKSQYDENKIINNFTNILKKYDIQKDFVRA